MKLKLSNVGALPDLEIEIDGLTVITGVNGTGKSTVLKSLYCALQPSYGFEEAKKEDSVLSLQSIITNSQGLGAYSMDETLDQLLEHARSIDPGRMSDNDIKKLELVEKLLKGERDNDFYRMRVEEAIRAEFDSLSQFINLRKGGTATMEIIDRTETYRCEVSSDGVSWEGATNRLPDVHYYDSPFVLDQRRALSPYPRDHREMLSETIHQVNGQSTVQAMLDRSKRNTFDSLVNGVVEGEISADARSFIARDGVKVSITNMAAGMKVFAVLRILADKGYLGSDCVLLLDEPEIHLHPMWINILAKTVATMVVDMGVRVVMTTHSPQLLMAIEGAVIDDGVPARFYDLSHGPDGLEFSGPLDDEGIQSVYTKMAGPIVEAGSRFMED